MEERAGCLRGLSKNYDFTVKWERIITFLVILCVLLAIGLGILWRFTRDKGLLYGL